MSERKGKYIVQKRDLSEENKWYEPKYYNTLYEIIEDLGISYATAHNLLHNKAEKYKKFYKITKNT